MFFTIVILKNWMRPTVHGFLLLVMRTSGLVEATDESAFSCCAHCIIFRTIIYCLTKTSTLALQQITRSIIYAGRVAASNIPIEKLTESTISRFGSYLSTYRIYFVLVNVMSPLQNWVLAETHKKTTLGKYSDNHILFQVFYLQTSKTKFYKLPAYSFKINQNKPIQYFYRNVL